MKTNTYTVRFADRSVLNVDAFNPKAARILAQAQRIREGRDYKVASVTLVGEP